MNERPDEEGCPAECELKTGFDRRGFLRLGSASVATVLLSEVFHNNVAAEDRNVTVQLATYPRLPVASLDSIRLQEPLEFFYPDNDHLHTGAVLIRLGAEAGGGVGRNRDIVAFSTRCTHMGGDLSDGYLSNHNVLGCGEHLTTFDLTRHGMVVAGHATESLPQIVLQVQGDEVYATGIIGLLYGYHQNPTIAGKQGNQ